MGYVGGTVAIARISVLLFTSRQIIKFEILHSIGLLVVQLKLSRSNVFPLYFLEKDISWGGLMEGSLREVIVY